MFGPIHSRRLGTSLGVNLSPDDGKVCSFDCLYCEAGFNAQGPGTTGFPSRQKVAEELRRKLSEMRLRGEKLDVITFSGNGEPTAHPDFAAIIDDTIALRDELCPGVKISVLSNSTFLHRPDVCRALAKVDNNILKLDSAVEATMQAIDRPNQREFTVARAIEMLSQFAGQAQIQTMLLDGINTSDNEIEALARAYQRIRPLSVTVYSIDRPTPDQTLVKVAPEKMRQLAGRLQALSGIPVNPVS